MASSGYNAQHRENKTLSDKDQLSSFILGGVGVQNLNGQIIENIKIPVGQEVAIPHSLGVTPKFRIVLRHIGGLQLTDGDTPWNEKTVYLKAEAPQFTSSGSVSGLTATYDTAFGMRIIIQDDNSGSLNPPCNKIATGSIPNNINTDGIGYIETDCLPDINVGGTVDVTVNPSNSEFITVSILLLRG